MPLQVTLSGLDRLRMKVQPAVHEAAVAQLLSDAALFTEAQARGFAPRDTGALARSITSEVNDLNQVRVYTTLDYASAVEEGRRPGATMPPPDALAGWAARHGFKGSLYVLARAISKRGIKGRFFMRRAVEALQRELPHLMEQAATRIEGKFGE